MPKDKPIKYEKLCRIYDIIGEHHLKHHTLENTAKKVGVCTRTVKNIMNDPIYHKIMQDELDKAGVTPTLLAQKIRQQLDATKQEPADRVQIDKAIDKSLKIYGGYAPQKMDFQHNITDVSDEDIDDKLAESLQKLKSNPAQAQDNQTNNVSSGTVKESGVGKGESGMEENPNSKG